MLLDFYLHISKFYSIVFFSKFIIGRQHCAVSSKSCNFLIVYSCLLIGKHYIVRTLSHGYYLVLLTVCSSKCFTLRLCNIYYYHMISVKKQKLPPFLQGEIYGSLTPSLRVTHSFHIRV